MRILYVYVYAYMYMYVHKYIHMCGGFHKEGYFSIAGCFKQVQNPKIKLMIWEYHGISPFLNQPQGMYTEMLRLHP